MPYHRSDEIRGVLLQCGLQRLLLANATVAEMLAKAETETIAQAPSWLLGELSWHGWKVPVVSFPALAGLGPSTHPVNSHRVVVLKALGGNPQRPYLALAIEGFPQLVAIPRDGLLVDASEQALPEAVHMRVRLGEHRALLPDLDAIERALDALTVDA